MDWKKLAKRLLILPGWLMGLMSAASAVLLALVFIKGWEESWIAYAVYVLAFYTLCAVTVFCVLVLPKQYGKLRQKIYDNPLANRYMTDRAFRTEVSLYLSLSVSLLYVGINLWSWYVNRSWWFVVLAVYYVIMAVMRFLLVRYVRTHEIGTSILGEWKRSRVCACVLLLVNLSLSGAVLMILYSNKGYDYPGILIYVMAMYTFYAVIHAIVELIKHRKMESPVMSAAKAVSLSGALVSLLNLETAMFAQFGGEMSLQDQRIFIILTGAGVSIAIVTLAVLLILRANQAIRNNGHCQAAAILPDNQETE